MTATASCDHPECLAAANEYTRRYRVARGAAAKENDLERWARIPFPGEWAARGACRGEPVADWVPRRGGSAAISAYNRTLCGGCEVRTDCLTYALRWPALVGIWGGATPDERSRMRARTTHGDEGDQTLKRFDDGDPI